MPLPILDLISLDQDFAAQQVKNGFVLIWYNLVISEIRHFSVIPAVGFSPENCSFVHLRISKISYWLSSFWIGYFL